MDNVKVELSIVTNERERYVITDYDKLDIYELIEAERQIQNILRYVHTSMYKAGM